MHRSPTRYFPHATRLTRSSGGFALVICLMLMTLLSVLAVGLLSLGSVSLRGASRGEARQLARANARVALAMALGQLQTHLGDDRRVTADSSILGSSMVRPHLVGAWNSASGGHVVNPIDKAPDYASWKSEKFRSWLVSHSDPYLVRDRGFAMTQPAADAPLLFSTDVDGFDLRADAVPLESHYGNAGAIAWAVSQEATKAKLNVGGAVARVDVNDEIQAPTRPNPKLSGLALQPRDGWGQRASKVIGAPQISLDAGYGIDGENLRRLVGSHTTHSLGVLCDVVKGGLKSDMSLGFEMADPDFAAPRWQSVRNPFNGGNAAGEIPLYQPLNGGTPLSVTINYGSVNNHTQLFHTGSSPTFHSLRSHYQLYRQTYLSGGSPTTFTRPQSSAYWPDLPAPRGSQTGIQPVLDRLLIFLSFHADEQGILNVVLTPVVTLWNPYNVALESDGFVVYPWMDFPVFVNWQINGANRGTYALSHLMGEDRTGTLNGRQAEPYFLCQLTASGAGDLAKPIRMGPGEVRIFVPSQRNLTLYQRRAPLDARTLPMKPVASVEDLDLSGGLRLRMNDSMANTLTHLVQPTDQIQAKLTFTRADHHYFVSMEDAGRMKSTKPRVLSEIQVYSGKLASQSITTRPFTGRQLATAPQAAALLETFHRTAGQSGQMSDLVFTVNPRQRHVNAMLSASSGFAAGPHYEASIREVADFISEAFQTTPDGRRSYYGYSNAPVSGRDALSFYEIPREPMLSLAAFQHADLADSAFTPGSQFGNAWASPFLARGTVARLLRAAATGERFQPGGLAVYDHSFLLNAALWDGYFFSSIAPETEAVEARGTPDGASARVTRSLPDVIGDWVEDPAASPLRNPRHLLHTGGRGRAEIERLLTSPAGCRHAAAHILVDGAFNVNSTDEAAWCSVLASLRGASFRVDGGLSGSYTRDSGDATPVPRLRRPIGSPGDLWNGFRELSDAEIKALSREIVKEVRARGPFQSLGEFVNRRLTSSNDPLGLKGALQAAIDRAGINQKATVATFDKSGYPFPVNLPEPYTGTGTPGWLTQADLLNSLGPVISVRSDTFTVRGYGEARDAEGRVLARSWCEAVVQRVPEWIDDADDPVMAPGDVTPSSARFGRRFVIVHFREIPPSKMDA